MPRDKIENQICRRDFLRRVSVTSAAALVAAQSVSSADEASSDGMPHVALGNLKVSRLIAGYNPVGGYSHVNPTYSRIMRDYFTVERTVEFLLHCEQEKINTFQFDLTEKTEQAVRGIQEKGSKLQFLCLQKHGDDIPRAREFGAVAVSHHGGVTDSLFRKGEFDKVHDYVKKAHDLGLVSGVSTHNPACVRRIMDEGWENDFFMTCFYRLSRTEQETVDDLKCTLPGEPFLDADRDAMTAVIRETPKPCLGFKILAAGRRCEHEGDVADAFKYAFAHIKKTDAVIVGMFPLYNDEVKEDAKLAEKFAVT